MDEFDEYGEDATPDYELWEQEQVFRDEQIERDSETDEDDEEPPWWWGPLD